MLFEYSLLTDKKEVEPLTDFLMDKGAYSVSIEDADAETEREKPISENRESRLMISLGTAPVLKSSAETTSTWKAH